MCTIIIIPRMYKSHKRRIGYINDISQHSKKTLLVWPFGLFPFQRLISQKWLRLTYRLFAFWLDCISSYRIIIYACLLLHLPSIHPFVYVTRMYLYLTDFMHSTHTQTNTNNFPGCFHDLLSDLGSAKPKKKYHVTLCPLSIQTDQD